jgi:hypothetical protein
MRIINIDLIGSIHDRCIDGDADAISHLCRLNSEIVYTLREVRKSGNIPLFPGLTNENSNRDPMLATASIHSTVERRSRIIVADAHIVVCMSNIDRR